MSPDRRNRLGGSDLAAAMGVNPYKTPVDLFLEKTGRTEARAPTTKMDWGNRLEQLVLDRYEEEAGIKTHRNRLPDGSQEIITHPKHAWLAGSPDAWAEDRIADAKTTGFRSAGRWGEPLTDEVPEEILIQVTTYMELKRVKLADVPVLFDGHDFRLYRVTFDAELAEIILERGERFWVDCVLADKPPEPLTADERMTLAKALHPRDLAPLLTSTSEFDQLAASLAFARETVRVREDAEEIVKAKICELLGDAAGVEGAWGRITWKRTKDSTAINWEAVAHELATANHTRHLMVEFAKKHLTTKPGHRRFLFTPKEKTNV